uniref:Uncharacterized protein n=1 Tax=Anguilla anguilla TaxID=7936 RepID=A0A0E9PKQ1_ANGAN
MLHYDALQNGPKLKHSICLIQSGAVVKSHKQGEKVKSAKCEKVDEYGQKNTETILTHTLFEFGELSHGINDKVSTFSPGCC